MRLLLLSAGLAGFLGMATAERKPPPMPKVIPNRWTVWLKENSTKTAKEHAEWASSLHEARSEGLAGLHHVIDQIPGMEGYEGEFTEHVVNMIRKDDDVSISTSDS